MNYLIAFSRQNIEKLKGLRKKLKGKIVHLYNLNVTDVDLYEVMNAELSILLAPYYLDASSIFESTITEFETLIEKITASIKGQVIAEIPTTIAAPVSQHVSPVASNSAPSPVAEPVSSQTDYLSQSNDVEPTVEVGGRTRKRVRKYKKTRQRQRKFKNRK